MNVSEIEEAMLALDRRDLAPLIHRGIQVLDRGDEDSSPEQIDSAWRDVLVQRIEDIQSGRVETVSLENSFIRARAAVAAMHE